MDYFLKHTPKFMTQLPKMRMSNRADLLSICFPIYEKYTLCSILVVIVVANLTVSTEEKWCLRTGFE
jgi:hypothetical protein